MITEKMRKQAINRLQHLDKSGKLKEKHIYLFGTDDYLRDVVDYLENKDYKIIKILDYNRQLWGQHLYGYEISSIERELLCHDEDAIIIMTDVSRPGESKKLDYLQYYYNEKRFWITQISQGKESIIQKIFVKNTIKYLIGKRQYKKNYKGVNMFVFPYNSIGDMYLLGLFKKNNAALFNEKFILVLPGRISEKVARIMGFNDIMVLSQKEINALCTYKNVVGEQAHGLRVIHYNFNPNHRFENVFFKNKINFFDAYEYAVLGEKLEYNNLGLLEHNHNSENHSIDIAKGSVILSPYCKSIVQIDMAFWEELAIRIKEKGYEVYTNCDGKKEKPVYGTRVLFVNMDVLCEYVEKAGFFIGIRSGLCDFISSTSARKVIVYPRIDKKIVDLRSFYSLDNIPFAVNYEEVISGIIASSGKIEETIEKLGI